MLLCLTIQHDARQKVRKTAEFAHKVESIGPVFFVALAPLRA